jgi:glycine/D-amino acid oxidase-like deaminating enzyme
VTRTADVVIIGGGVIGTSLALHLAQRGVRHVVLLERRFLAAGGTGRSVGIVRQLYPTLETTLMVRHSLGVFQQFDEVVGGTAGYVPCGVLIGVSHAMRAGLERTLAQQQSAGVRATLLEPDALASIEPRIDPSGLGAVLHEPESGYGDPTAVTLAYAAAARRHGVVVEQGVEVIGVRVSRDRVIGVDTSAGDRIDAPAVVNAAGLWSPAVARLAGITLPIVVGRHPVFVIQRDEAFGPAHAVYLDLSGGAYVRPETGGLTLTGSLTDDETQHPMDPEALGSEVGLDEAEETLARTGRTVPRLADARYRSGYAGAFDITPDWMPILDESPVHGFYVAAGMSGHGFKLAPAIGAMMAAVVTASAPPISVQPFRLDRFTRIGPASGFVSSYLGS